MKSRICKLCGKEFQPRKPKQVYCDNVHYATCPVCEKQFEIIPRDARMYCSKECRVKGTHATLVNTMMERYGVVNPSQHPEFSAKAARSISAVSDQITKHRQATMLERYGGVSAMSSPELRAKIDATNIAKYGNTNPAKNAEIRKKISDALKSDEVQSKYQQTSLSHYGVKYPAQSKEILDRMTQTCLERYGVKRATGLPDIAEKAKQTCMGKYGVPCAFLTPEAQEKARQSFLAKEYSGRISGLNKTFASLLEGIGLKVDLEAYIDRKWYDIALPDEKIVVEIDPSYTHSTLPNHWSPTGLKENSQLLKTEFAKASGYRCIHIFDWDNWDSMLELLSPKQIIYARNTEVKEISKQSADDFISRMHIQGQCKGGTVFLGLFYKDILVEVMTFGKPRYTHKYEYELLRLCTGHGLSVTGGASKLFKYFVNQYQPKSIISYCDLAKFTGHVYEQMGMKLDHTTAPAKVWSKGNSKITDNLLRQRGFDALFKTNYGKGTSNEQLMIEHNWLPVYDCGQAVYTYMS